MFDGPLHPALVHFPIALAVLMPLIALFILIGIRKNLFNSRVWLIVIFVQSLFAISTIVAVRTGGNEEETVEKIVAEKYIEAHEELAEKVPWAAGVILLFTILGCLKSDKFSTSFQIFSIISMFALGGLVLKVGHSGGELVYKHNAASAYQPEAKSIQSH